MYQCFLAEEPASCVIHSASLILSVHRFRMGAQLSCLNSNQLLSKRSSAVIVLGKTAAQRFGEGKLWSVLLLSLLSILLEHRAELGWEQINIGPLQKAPPDSGRRLQLHVPPLTAPPSNERVRFQHHKKSVLFLLIVVNGGFINSMSYQGSLQVR